MQEAWISGNVITIIGMIYTMSMAVLGATMSFFPTRKPIRSYISAVLWCYFVVGAAGALLGFIGLLLGQPKEFWRPILTYSCIAGVVIVGVIHVWKEFCSSADRKQERERHGKQFKME